MRYGNLALVLVALLLPAGCNRTDPNVPAEQARFLKDYDAVKGEYTASKTPEKLAALNALVAKPQRVSNWVGLITAPARDMELDLHGEKSDSVWIAIRLGPSCLGELFRLKMSPDDTEMAGKLLALKKDQRVKFSAHSTLKEIAEKESGEGTEIPVVFAIDQLTVME